MRRETPDAAWKCPPVPTRKRHTPPPERILMVDSIPLPMAGD
ncbi:MAG: hypothetical protein M5U34_12540 [Chloroflexi bacterium]|nr:hypothetical protein [Chloroflexota bacterium]